MAQYCPACNEPGKWREEDQYKCENSRCRVTLFEVRGQI